VGVDEDSERAGSSVSFVAGKEICGSLRQVVTKRDSVIKAKQVLFIIYISEEEALTR
jgi:hypothetical protein